MSNSPVPPDEARVFRHERVAPTRWAEPTRAAQAFHQKLPGYAATRVLSVIGEADRTVWAKDETSRLGLPAFKVLGASWAAYRLLCDRLGHEPEWSRLEDLRAEFARLPSATFVTATEGNHGRAVARVAMLMGMRSRIYIPAGLSRDRARLIAGEGAEVVRVDGDYDAAVDAATAWSDPTSILLQDTSTKSTDPVSELIAEGYSTMLWEVEDELARRGAAPLDMVLVQVGVGTLAHAVVRHFRRPSLLRPPSLVAVEPVSAAGLLESAVAGQLTVAPGACDSLMTCISVATPSAAALSDLLAGIDIFVGATDDALGRSLSRLEQSGVAAGPTGAAGLVGLHDLDLYLERHEGRRVPASNILIIVSEGPVAASVAGDGSGD